MKSLTLHAMDDQLADQIRRRASEMSISMNELAKRILAEGLGIKTPARPPRRDDFACFCGTWDELRIPVKSATDSGINRPLIGA